MAKLAVLTTLLLTVAAATISSAHSGRTLEGSAVERAIIPSAAVAEAPSSTAAVDVAALSGDFDVPAFEEAAAGGPIAAVYRGTDCAHKVPVFRP